MNLLHNKSIRHLLIGGNPKTNRLHAKEDDAYTFVGFKMFSPSKVVLSELFSLFSKLPNSPLSWQM